MEHSLVSTYQEGANMVQRILKLVMAAAAASTFGVGPAHGETVGYGTIVMIPVVVQTSSFSTELYVHNPLGATTNIFPVYYGATGSATPGVTGCPVIAVAAAATSQYSLTTLCPSLSAGSNFGMLRLYEIDATNRPFGAYVRVNSAQGQGFSIEGFPVGTFANSKGSAFVLGLKRISSPPGYTTNCFAGSLAEAVTVNVALFTNTGASLGTSFNIVLAANQFVRILDIFGAAGVNAPPGDYSNVRAQFFENGAGEPSFIAFCTVQNNTSFDADFRIAKTFLNASDDEAKEFTTSVSFNAGVSTDSAGNLIPTPDSSGIEHNWVTFIQHPDWISCAVTGVTGTIEMQLLDPEGNVVAGGSGFTSFPETYLGEKSTRHNGVNGLWRIQVGDAASTSPSAYTLTCNSGNGMSRLIYGGSSPDSF